MTRNEAREIIGLSPITGGDELYINAALMPIGSADVEEPEDPIDTEDEKEYDEEFLDDLDILDSKDELTNFPKRGEDKKISLRNSQYPQFDYGFAKDVKDSPIGKEIWKTGGNIRGNEAFVLWGRAREGSETPAVLKWIKEREAWAARHFRDGQKFKDGKTEPNLSNVAGVVAQIKWGVIGTLGQQGMKDVVLELDKKLRGKKEPEEKDVPIEDTFIFTDDNHEGEVEDTKELSARVKEALKKKVDEHNEKYGDNPKKKTNLRTLSAVFRRGVGAYNTNPSSVRPGVRASGGADRWAYARVNSYLFALRTGRHQGGKHDTDLFPDGHPLKAKGPTDGQGRPKKK